MKIPSLGILFCSVLLICLFPSVRLSGAQRAQSAVPVQRTTPDIVASVRQAVVTISVKDATGTVITQGSGFVVRSDGVIVTNWHVLAGGATAAVRLSTGEVFDRVGFLDGDEAADVALLKVPGFRRRAVEVAASIPDVGAKTIALGSPLGLDFSVSEGIVSAVRVEDGRQLIQTTAAISSGSSGGPLLDQRGRVFAIVTSTLREGQQLNFAVPVKYATGLISTRLTERPLSEVFGSATTAVENTSAGDLNRLATPRPDLSGVYVWNKRARESGSGILKGEEQGFLVAGDKVGLITLPEMAGAWRLDTLRTNAIGEVALSFVDSEWGGYQTKEGFVATRLSGTTVYQLQATRLTPPLSDNTGLYSIECRCSSETDLSEDVGIDYRGEAAVLVVGETISVDMKILNEHGGGAEFHSVGPLVDGRFELVAQRLRLNGRVGAGALTATLTMPGTAGGTIQGVLSGERK